MLNRSKRREFEERIRKGTMNVGHLNSLSVSDLITLCNSCGVPVSHKRGDMVNSLMSLNGNRVKIDSAPTYNLSRDGLEDMILGLLNDKNHPATAKIREEISETVVVSALYVLRNEFGFGAKRLGMFLKEFNLVADGIADDMIDREQMKSEVAKPFKDGKCDVKLKYSNEYIKGWYLELIKDKVEK